MKGIVTYKVVLKSNGKYAPRIFNTMFVGGNWFEEPYEYDKLDDAILALVKKKEENSKLRNEDIVVFTLE